MPGKGGRRGKCGKDEYREFPRDRSSPRFGGGKRERRREHLRVTLTRKKRSTWRALDIIKLSIRPVRPSVRPFQWFIRAEWKSYIYFPAATPPPPRTCHTSSRDARLRRRLPRLFSPLVSRENYERFSRSHGRHDCSHVTLMPLAHGILTFSRRVIETSSHISLDISK